MVQKNAFAVETKGDKETMDVGILRVYCTFKTP
jgi:hypothetical protein